MPHHCETFTRIAYAIFHKIKAISAIRHGFIILSIIIYLKIDHIEQFAQNAVPINQE